MEKVTLSYMCYKKNFRKAVYPSDFPRRSRPYDPASFKCHEWRQVGMFMFPVLIRHLESSKGHEKSVFLAFSYMNRAVRMPQEEYSEIPEDSFNDALNILNENYDQAYGETANSYNFHIVSAHLKEIREQQGPLTNFTAYPFESSYAELRRSFQVATRKFF